MNESPSYGVAIVTTEMSLKELEGISSRLHTWVAKIPNNEPHIKTLWNKGGEASPEKGITSFNVASTESPFEMICNQMRAIDLHHGEYSHNPPWSFIEIYGPLDEASLKGYFKEFGNFEIEGTRYGFVVRKVDDPAGEPNKPT